MRLMIEFSDNFLLEAKKLSKKYRALKKDLQGALLEIQERDFGVSLGYNLYKKRVSNSSIPTGKSGGFRVIIFLQTEKKITLLSIYSKTQKETLSDAELRQILHEYLK